MRSGPKGGKFQEKGQPQLLLLCGPEHCYSHRTSSLLPADRAAAVAFELCAATQCSLLCPSIQLWLCLRSVSVAPLPRKPDCSGEVLPGQSLSLNAPPQPRPAARGWLGPLPPAAAPGCEELCSSASSSFEPLPAQTGGAGSDLQRLFQR